MSDIKATTPIELFSKNILSDNLYNDICNVCQQDGKYKGVYITGYLFSLFSYFASNKLYIKTGNFEPLTPKLGMLIVGSSQDGKTQAGNLILNPLRSIDRESTIHNIELTKLNNSLKALKNGEEYQNLSDINKIEKIDNYKNGYLYAHPEFGVNYKNSEEPKPSYIYSDFNLQTLAAGYLTNLKNTLLIQNDEFGTLIDNFNNGLNPTDKFEYILSAIDGKDTIIRRKTQEPIVSNGSAIVVSSTTHSKFDVIKSSLFGGGLGNRLFYVITPIEPIQMRVASICTHDKSVAKFEEKIKDITNDLINLIQSNSAQTLLIDTPEKVNLYNELKSNLWYKYKTDELSESINNDLVNGIFGRFDMNLQQTILVIFLINKLWNNNKTYEQNYYTLSIDDIKRGAAAYDYFLNNMVKVHTAKSETKLTPKQENCINLFEINDTFMYSEFTSRINRIVKDNPEKKGNLLSDKAARNFMDSPVFLEYFEKDINSKVPKFRRVK